MSPSEVNELFAWVLLGNEKKISNEQLTISLPLNRSCLFLRSKMKKKKVFPQSDFPRGTLKGKA